MGYVGEKINYIASSYSYSACPATIVTFGRRPRLKTSAQVIAELEALRREKISIAFVVDDNLIGNKKAIKVLLRDLIAWQEEQGYPMRLFTEASLDLAEDAELLRLMVVANFGSVFIGIESPNEASLRETRKYQNVRGKGGTMLERVHTIQAAGLEVWSGMILGFDNDDPSVFDAQQDFVREARISHAMVGMLTAIPKTPLHRRLASEGRLDTNDISEFGTNVIPLRMSRQMLRDGYVQVMKDLYQPEAFFGRLDALFIAAKPVFFPAMRRYWRKHPWRYFKELMRDVTQTAGLFARLMLRVPEASLRREYRRRLIHLLRERPDPHLLFVYTVKCAMHYHHYTMSAQMTIGRSAIVNSF